MTECTCTQTPPEQWTTHYGAVDPASQLEWDPDCPEHGETAAADRVRVFLVERASMEGIDQEMIARVNRTPLLAADLHELVYQVKSAKELRESQGPVEFEMLGDAYSETPAQEWLSIPIPLDDETLARMAEAMSKVSGSYTFETLARVGLEALINTHPQFNAFKERALKDPAVQEAYESAKDAPISAQLSAAMDLREAVPGDPSIASVSEVADEVVRWLDGIADRAPGIHEAVANRLGNGR